MIGSITQPDIIECEANPSFAEMPSMETMTRYALDHLSRDNDKGFFLTIESASIDKKSHERDACGSIGEIKQLEEALAVAMDYAAENPNTLVMVTADHSQAAQIIPDPTLYTSLHIWAEAARLFLGFSLINLFVCLFWTSAGHLLASYLQHPVIWRTFMTTMAAMMASSAALIFI